MINTPLLPQLRPVMQNLADRFEGAVSGGVTMELDVVYVETCAHEQGTLKRPAVGAVRGIVETAMGRAWLAQLTAADRNRFLARARRERPGEYERSTEGLKDSIANYAKRGFSINMGDAGLVVLGWAVASNIRYGPRSLVKSVSFDNLALDTKRMDIRELTPVPYVARGRQPLLV